jgi:hypothetical protein
VPFIDIGNYVWTALAKAVGEHLCLRTARPAPCVERCGVLNFYASFCQSVCILTSATLWLVLLPGSCFCNLKFRPLENKCFDAVNDVRTIVVKFGLVGMRWKKTPW